MSDTVVVACVSDTHGGSTVALCPPVVALDDGGAYQASPGQSWLWGLWREFWGRVSEKRESEKADLYVVCNGDIVDGDHHNTPQILSRNPNAQAEVVRQVWDIPLGMDPDAVFVVRGTESHVGNSGSTEEAIAKGWFNNHPVQKCPDTGTFSWFHVRLDVLGHRLDIAHHGRMGRLPWTKAGLAARDAAHIFYEHARNKERWPDLALRAHNHQVADSFDAHPVRYIAMPAWQLSTAYVHRLAAGKTLADIGGIILTIREGRPIEVEKWVQQPSRGTVWQG